MSTPAGWYQDPNSANQQRWWDGEQWTETTAPLDEPGREDTIEVVAEPPSEISTGIAGVYWVTLRKWLGRTVFLLMLLAFALIMVFVFIPIIKWSQQPPPPDLQARQTLLRGYRVATEVAVLHKNSFGSVKIIQQAIERREPQLAPVSISRDSSAQAVAQSQRLVVQRASRRGNLLLAYKTSSGIVWQLRVAGNKPYQFLRNGKPWSEAG